MRDRRICQLLCLALLTAAVVALAGCGANQSQSSSPADLPTEDVLLFGADEPAPEAWAQSGVKATVTGIALKTNGHFYQRTVGEGDTKVHSFATKAGVAYQVEAVGLRNGDDVDLVISRNSAPLSDAWKYSMRPPPKMEGFVFRSAQDGTMYVGAHGHYTSFVDAKVRYAIHVRKCEFGTFSQ